MNGKIRKIINRWNIPKRLLRKFAFISFTHIYACFLSIYETSNSDKQHSLHIKIILIFKLTYVTHRKSFCLLSYSSVKRKENSRCCFAYAININYKYICIRSAIIQWSIIPRTHTYISSLTRNSILYLESENLQKTFLKISFHFDRCNGVW